MKTNMENIIEDLWNVKDEITPHHVAAADIKSVLKLLDEGKLRVCFYEKGVWQVMTWVKKALVLSFRIQENCLFSRDAQTVAYDKVPLKFSHWTQDHFQNSGIRAVPGSIVRYSAYISPGVVLMPSFVNIGAFIGQNTMIDTWATVGSCAQIGDNCHISGGAGIGGVLEPLQANPVIIEDNCFIGARSEVVEGVIVEQGSVLGMGVYLGASTPIYHREKDEIYYGRVPSYSVVLPGSLPGKVKEDGERGPGLYCAVIVKTVDEKTRSKTAINDLLRPFP